MNETQVLELGHMLEMKGLRDDEIDNILSHHGVKGMKWGVRKAQLGSAAKATGRGISRGAKATGRGVSRGAKAAGRGAKKVGTFAKDNPEVVLAGAAFVATVLAGRAAAGRSGVDRQARTSVRRTQTMTSRIAPRAIPLGPVGSTGGGRTPMREVRRTMAANPGHAREAARIRDNILRMDRDIARDFRTAERRIDPRFISDPSNYRWNPVR